MPVVTQLAPTPGGPQLLTLWLLITTNRSFLLDPATKAGPIGADTFPAVPGTSDRVTGGLTQIASILQTGNSNPDPFAEKGLRDFLAVALAEQIAVDGNGNPFGPTAGEVLAMTCGVFENFQKRFAVGWSRACPARMDEILL